MAPPLRGPGALGLIAVPIALVAAPIALLLSLPPPARAAEPDPIPVASAAPAPGRPQIEVAVGMGASIDDAGLSAAGMSAVPSFFAMGGFGEGVVGIDLGVFANSATGRFRAPNVPVDRLGFDGLLVIRPLSEQWLPNQRYFVRMARLLAIDLGLGLERASRITRAPESVNRFGLRLGAHADFPLTPRTARTELRLRLAFRRFVGASRTTFPGTDDAAADTRGEVFAALATVF